MQNRIKTTRDIATTVRGRRLQLGFSQVETARRARVSRQWLSGFESGKPTAELRLVFQLLDALGLEVSLKTKEALPDRDESSVDVVDLDVLLDRYRKT